MNDSNEALNSRLSSYKRFEELLKDKKLTAYKIHKATGIATATLSDWKNGKSMPKREKMILIANELGTTPDYIVFGENNEFSDNSVELDLRISNDSELKDAIKKYYSLSNKKKKHVIELINMLSEVE